MEGSTALWQAILAARLSTDSIYLQTLWTVAARLKSNEIFESSYELAADAGATTAARVTAMYILLAQYNRHLTARLQTWTSLLTVPMGSMCRFGSGIHGDYASTHSTLAPSHLQQAALALESVVSNPASQPVLRDLARCARLALAKDLPEEVNPSQLSLTYECGTRFRVNNAGIYGADVKYKVVGVTEQGDLVVEPGSFTTFKVVSTGSVQLLFKGQVVQEVANAGTPCPP